MRTGRHFSVAPFVIALAISGFLYVEPASAQVIKTVAGYGWGGFAGDGGSATRAGVYRPRGVAADSAGNFYIADTENHRIRKVSVDGIIRTVAGNGARGFSGDGGFADRAQLNTPTGVAVDRSGNIYIADELNHRIRKVDVHEIITTVAGTGVPGFSGDGRPATAAQLAYPSDVEVDQYGNLFIADTHNNRVRRIDPSGTIVSYAGSGPGIPFPGGFSGDGGPATRAQLNHPAAIALDSAGNIFIADTANFRIRKVEATSGTILTYVGSGEYGFSGDGGPATSAAFREIYGVTVDSHGDLYIADSLNDRVRKVDVISKRVVTYAGNGVRGFSGDNGPATAAQLAGPNGIAVDLNGFLYLADSMNNRVRMVGR